VTRCASCGGENRAGARFCNDCGNSINANAGTMGSGAAAGLTAENKGTGIRLALLDDAGNGSWVFIKEPYRLLDGDVVLLGAQMAPQGIPSTCHQAGASISAAKLATGSSLTTRR